MPAVKACEHIILFAGHMVDKPGRATPRFPPAMEAAARESIERELDALLGRASGARLGMSGAARGGDILFLEACGARGVPTLICLPLPEEKFLTESVEGVSADWVRRFHALWDAHVEDARKILPAAPAQEAQENVYVRYNRWLVGLAAELGAQIHLMTLWNGEKGDGPGGTEDVVRGVQKLSGEIIHIDTRPLLQKLLSKGEAR